MLELQRDAIRADAQADSTALLYRQLESTQSYLATIGTQASLISQLAEGFNLSFLYSCPTHDFSPLSQQILQIDIDW